MKVLEVIHEVLVESSGALLSLDEDDEVSLKKLIRKGKTQRRIADRARMLLWASQGHSPKEIGKRLHLTPKMVIYWISRFKKNKRDGLPQALHDLPRVGRPRKQESEK